LIALGRGSARFSESSEVLDMPWRPVRAKLRSLKKEELVESPDKGVYVISDKGKAAIS